MTFRNTQSQWTPEAPTAIASAGRATRFVPPAKGAVGLRRTWPTGSPTRSARRRPDLARHRPCGSQPYRSGSPAKTLPEQWKLDMIEDVLGLEPGTLAGILYDRPPRPVQDRAGAIEDRLDRVELQLNQMIELLHDLDRRILGRSPDDGEAGPAPR